MTAPPFSPCPRVKPSRDNCEGQLFALSDFHIVKIMIRKSLIDEKLAG